MNGSILDMAMKAAEAKNFEPAELRSDVPDCGRLIDAICAASPAPVYSSGIFEGREHAYGVYDHRRNKILVAPDLPELQLVKAILHEAAHAILHPWPDGVEPDGWDAGKRAREIQAEGVACAVCSHYNLDTTAYSVPYMAGWCRKLEVSEIRACEAAIKRASEYLIDRIDAELK